MFSFSNVAYIDVMKIPELWNGFDEVEQETFSYPI